MSARAVGFMYRLSSCAGKSTFPSFRAAEREAMWARREREENLQPYHCKFCHKYHIGAEQSGKAGDYKRQKRALKEQG